MAGKVSGKLGVVLGAGSSLDRVPEGLWVDAMLKTVVAVNRACLSKRLAAFTAFHEVHCCGYDSFRPDEDPSVLMRLAKYGQIANERTGDLWLDLTWTKHLPSKARVKGVPSMVRPKHNSAEMAAKILVRAYGCGEIWLLGCDCIGNYCETDPWLDPFPNAGQAAFSGSAVKFWKQTIQELEDEGACFKIWPKESLLYGLAVKDVIR